MTDLECNARLAEAMGARWWTFRVDVDGGPPTRARYLSPEPVRDTDRELRPGESFIECVDGTRDVPRYSSSPSDFAFVEQAIHDRGLGRDYVRALAMTAEMFGEEFDDPSLLGFSGAWDLMRAPLAVKSRAALSVLEGNT